MTGPPRLPLLPPADAVAAAATVGVSSAAANLNVFRAWLHHPELAGWMHELLMGLLWKGKLDKRLRELVIMRVGWTTGSVYEWTQHWGIATSWLELDADDLLATRDWQANDRFGAAERAILAATDETVASGTVTDATWAACRDDIGDSPEILLEVVAVIGVWRMVSSALRSLEIPLEDGVAPWPPDGLPPP